MGSQETMEGLAIQTSAIQPQAYPLQQDWLQWHHVAAFASNAFEHQWTDFPEQPIGQHQWAETPGYPGEGPKSSCAVWPPFSEDFSCEQQSPTHGRGGGTYGAEEMWVPAMPPSPQLTPTWHHAQLLPSQPHTTSRAIETHSIDAASPRGQKSCHVREWTPKDDMPALARVTSQSACTDTMATPPGESENETTGPSNLKKRLSRQDESAAIDTTAAVADAAKPAHGKKYRIKNRAAAKRCRDKSRQFEIDLAAKERQVTEHHMVLEASAAALREEILILKNQILQHGDCDCEVIQAYISKVASQVSTASARQQATLR